MKHFLKLLDCTTEEIYELLDLAATMKQYVKEGKEHHFLKGKTLGMIFEKSLMWMVVGGTMLKES